MKWLANNFLQVITCGLLLWILLRPKDTSVEQYQLKILQMDNEEMRAQRDSLQGVINQPLPVPEKSDSLTQVAVDLNRQTLYEIRKRNAARTDTAGSDELRRIYAGFH